jgi:hypothetical protein
VNAPEGMSSDLSLKAVIELNPDARDIARSLHRTALLPTGVTAFQESSKARKHGDSFRLSAEAGRVFFFLCGTTPIILRLPTPDIRSCHRAATYRHSPVSMHVDVHSAEAFGRYGRRKVVMIPPARLCRSASPAKQPAPPLH